MSSLVATTIDDDDEDDDEDNVREIPLPNVKNAVLIKVIEYCTHYKEEAMNPIKTPLQSSKLEELVQAWYVNFVKVEKDFLFELVTAANFMDIKPMLDLTVLAVCIFIKVCIWCFKWNVQIFLRISNTTFVSFVFVCAGKTSIRASGNVQYQFGINTRGRGSSARGEQMGGAPLKSECMSGTVVCPLGGARGWHHIRSCCKIRGTYTRYLTQSMCLLLRE